MLRLQTTSPHPAAAPCSPASGRLSARPRHAAARVLVIGVAAAIVMLRPRLRHIVVAGTSMYPTLQPGDRLITISTRCGPRVGGLALAPDPRAPQRVLIKRVHAITAGLVDLRGDAASASTDSRTFGAVPLRAVEGCAVVRYYPAERAGRVNASRAPEHRRRCRRRGPR